MVSGRCMNTVVTKHNVSGRCMNTVVTKHNEKVQKKRDTFSHITIGTNVTKGVSMIIQGMSVSSTM